MANEVQTLLTAIAGVACFESDDSLVVVTTRLSDSYRNSSQRAAICSNIVTLDAWPINY